MEENFLGTSIHMSQPTLDRLSRIQGTLKMKCAMFQEQGSGRLSRFPADRVSKSLDVSLLCFTRPNQKIVLFTCLVVVNTLHSFLSMYISHSLLQVLVVCCSFEWCVLFVGCFVVGSEFSMKCFMYIL